ncbi:ThiF family adenylyltransferase [Achromobacter aloeverae]
MRFQEVDLPDLTEALKRRGFDYVGAGVVSDTLRFVGAFNAQGVAHSCALDVHSSLDRVPYVWITDIPAGLPNLTPHLGKLGNLCYIARGSVVFDLFDPIGQTLACVDRAELVFTKILAGDMVEDLADEFFIYWQGPICIEDVQDRGSRDLQAFSASGPGRELLLITDDRARSELKLKLLDVKLPDRALAVARVRTDAKPMPLRDAWPLKTFAETYAWQCGLDQQAAHRMLRAVLELVRRGESEILVAVDAPNVSYAFRVQIPIQQGRRGKPTPYREILFRRPVFPLTLWRIDDEYMARRNLPSGKTLAGLRIALVGCGTIGGYLADMLVKAGAGTSGGVLTLIDNDLLGPQNLGRHRLSFMGLFRNKASALRGELLCTSPGAQIGALVTDAKLADLGDIDLLVDATGEQALTDWLTWKYVSRFPILSTWVEGAGLAVRSLLKHLPRNACARCISRGVGRDELQVFTVPTPITLRGHGCEDLYVPFPVTASVQAAALAMEMIQAWANGVDQPTFQTRVLTRELTQQTFDCSPARVEGCPACST